MIKKILISMEDNSPSSISDKIVSVLEQSTTNNDLTNLQEETDNSLEESNVLLSDVGNATDELKILEDANNVLKEQLNSGDSEPVDEVALELLKLKSVYVEDRWGLKVFNKKTISTEDFSELSTSSKVSETKELVESLDEGLSSSSDLVSKGSIVAVDGIIDSLKKLALKAFSQDNKTVIEAIDWDVTPGSGFIINDPIILSLLNGESDEVSVGNLMKSLERVKSVISESFTDVLFSKLDSYFENPTQFSPFDVLREIFKKGEDGHLSAGHKHLKLADCSIGGDNLIAILGGGEDESTGLIIEKEDGAVTPVNLSVPNKADVLALIDELNEIKKIVLENLEKTDVLQGKVRNCLQNHPLETCPVLVRLSTLLPEWIVKGVTKLISAINEFIIRSAESSQLAIGQLDESLLDQELVRQENDPLEAQEQELREQTLFVDDLYQAAGDIAHAEELKAVIDNEIQNDRPVSKLAVELYISSVKGVCKRWGFPTKDISNISLEDLSAGTYNQRLENLKTTLEGFHSTMNKALAYVGEAIVRTILWLKNAWEVFTDTSSKLNDRIEDIGKYVGSGYGGNSEYEVEEGVEIRPEGRDDEKIYHAFQNFTTAIDPSAIEKAFKENEKEIEDFRNSVLDPIIKEITDLKVKTVEELSEFVGRYIYRNTDRKDEDKLKDDVKKAYEAPFIPPIGDCGLLVEKNNPLDIKYYPGVYIFLNTTIKTGSSSDVARMCKEVSGRYYRYYSTNSAVKDQIKTLEKLKNNKSGTAVDKKVVAFVTKLIMIFYRIILESIRKGLRGTLSYLRVCGYDKGMAK